MCGLQPGFTCVACPTRRECSTPPLSISVCLGHTGLHMHLDRTFASDCQPARICDAMLTQAYLRMANIKFTEENCRYPSVPSGGARVCAPSPGLLGTHSFRTTTCRHAAAHAARVKAVHSRPNPGHTCAGHSAKLLTPTLKTSTFNA